MKIGSIVVQWILDIVLPKFVGQTENSNAFWGIWTLITGKDLISDNTKIMISYMQKREFEQVASKGGTHCSLKSRIVDRNSSTEDSQCIHWG